MTCEVCGSICNGLDPCEMCWMARMWNGGEQWPPEEFPEEFPEERLAKEGR